MMLDIIRGYISEARQDLREWARGHVREALANFVISTIIDQASEGQGSQDPLVHKARLWSSTDGQTTANTDSGEKSTPVARASEHPGFACVPRDGDPCILIGQGANLLMLPLASKRWRPTGIKQSEVVIYNLAEALKQGVIKIDKDGAISVKAAQSQKVTVDAGAGADVVVNGGTAKVGRVGDDVDMGRWQVNTVTIGPNTFVTQILWTAPGGGAPIPLVNLPTPLTGKIASGADRFKG